MRDSPRWCDTCQRWGDHHTDRHIPHCPLLGHEQPVEGPNLIQVVAPNGTEFKIGVCDEHLQALSDGPNGQHADSVWPDKA